MRAEALARRGGWTDGADHPVYGVEVVHLHTAGEAPHAAPGLEKHFRTNALLVGPNVRGAVGGQMDFIRGASLSEGGKPIIALPSQTGRGVSRIVPTLKHGAGVVTMRAHVHWVVTEYGAVNLYGKNLRQRASALIDIAHPDHREALAAEALARFGG